jgi:hypothetical protein
VAAPSAISSVCQSAAVFPVVAGACTSLLSNIRRPSTAALIALTPQLSHDVKESLFYIDTILRRRFDEVTSEILGKSLSLLCGHFALGDSITLISYKHHGRLAKHWSRSAHR